MSPTGGAAMSHFERLLQDDLNRLIDRIAVRAGEGTAAGLKSDLKAHIQRAEERRTVLRAALLGVLLRVALEALPVVRQLAGKEDLARQRTRSLVGRRRLGLLVARPQIGG